MTNSFLFSRLFCPLSGETQVEREFSQFHPLSLYQMTSQPFLTLVFHLRFKAGLLFWFFEPKELAGGRGL